MPRLTLIAVVALVPLLAHADNKYRSDLRKVVDELDAAEDAARDSRGPCRRDLAEDIGKALDHVDALKERHGRFTKDADIFAARNEVAQLANQAPWRRCPARVVNGLNRAVTLLDQMRLAHWQRSGQEMPNAVFAQLAPLRVQGAGRWDDEKSVKVSVPDLTLSGLQGHTFYLAARFRSTEGRWTEWVTTQQWSIPNNSFSWKNPFTHFIRYSTLAEEDFGNGRFIAQVAIFDGNGTMLATREAPFQARGLPKLAAAPPPPPGYRDDDDDDDRRPPGYQQPPPGYDPTQSPPGYQQPPPGYHPANPATPTGRIQARDCGTGADPGCEMRRNGLVAMDAPTFSGLITSMRSNNNELSRRDIFVAVMKSHGITAMQLGTVLDYFPNEQVRMDVARFAAPRLMNPSHALGFAAKWKNSILARDYTTLMAGQK